MHIQVWVWVCFWNICLCQCSTKQTNQTGLHSALKGSAGCSPYCTPCQLLHKLFINHSWNKTNQLKCYESKNLSPPSAFLHLLSVTAAHTWPVLSPLPSTAHGVTHAKDATERWAAHPAPPSSYSVWLPQAGNGIFLIFCLLRPSHQ